MCVTGQFSIQADDLSTVLYKIHGRKAPMRAVRLRAERPPDATVEISYMLYKTGDRCATFAFPSRGRLSEVPKGPVWGLRTVHFYMRGKALAGC